MLTTLDGGRTVNAYLHNPYPNGFNLPLSSPDGPNSGASTNIGLGVGESFFNDSQNPVIQQWNLNRQRELPAGMVVEPGYLASKGNHLIDGEGNRTYNQFPASFGDLGNALNDQVPNPFFGIITNPTSALSQSNVFRSQLLRPFPQYTRPTPFITPSPSALKSAPQAALASSPASPPASSSTTPAKPSPSSVRLATSRISTTAAPSAPSHTGYRQAPRHQRQLRPPLPQGPQNALRNEARR